MTYDILLDFALNLCYICLYITLDHKSLRSAHTPSMSIYYIVFLELTLSLNYKVDVENGSFFQSDTWERTCKVVSLASVA